MIPFTTYFHEKAKECIEEVRDNRKAIKDMLGATNIFHSFDKQRLDLCKKWLKPEEMRGTERMEEDVVVGAAPDEPDVFVCYEY